MSSKKTTQTLGSTLRRLRAILVRFRPEIRAQRALIVSSGAALVLESLLRLLEPWPLKFVIDQVIVDTPSGGSSGIAAVDRLDSGTLLVACAIAVVAIAGLRAVVAYLSTVGLALAGNRVLTKVRGDLYRHLQRLSLSYHSKARRGDLITRVTGDIGRLQEVTVTAAMPLLANTLTLVGMVGVMAWINWQLALLALAVFPLFALSLGRRVGRIHGVSRETRRLEGAMATSAAESMGAIKVVQTLSLEDTLDRRFSRENSASLKQGVQTKRLSAGLERKVDVLVSIGTALVLWHGARLVQQGAITPGDLVLFLLYLKAAFKPMRDLAKYTGRLASAAAAGERVLEVLDTEPDIRDRPGAITAPPFEGSVRFEDVSLAFDDGEPVLSGVDLEIEPGRQVALVGPSGAGKSTLVSLLSRLYDPDRGRVMIDGRDVRDYTLESLRTQIAVVLQESVLFGVSVRENIAFGAVGVSDEQIESAARIANAHEFIERLPKGYDTVVGERGETLSGGERQRIAIARAAVRRAPIVILDEPATGLDSENERAVSEALRRLAEGRTTLTIAHDLRSVEHADLIVYLDRGCVIEQGTHAELMARRGRYAAVHLLQSAERGELAPEAIVGASTEWTQ